MKALTGAAYFFAGMVAYFCVMSVISAKEQSAERTAERAEWCRAPHAGERMIAYGSSDGKPFCEYAVNFGYGEVPRPSE